MENIEETPEKSTGGEGTVAATLGAIGVLSGTAYSHPPSKEERKNQKREAKRKERE